MNDIEEWRPAANTDGHFEVSSLGLVRRTDTGAELNPGWPANGGTPVLTLSFSGRKKTVRLPALVAETFLGPRPPGYRLAYKDGNRANFRADNLEYLRGGAYYQAGDHAAPKARLAGVFDRDYTWHLLSLTSWFKLAEEFGHDPFTAVARVLKADERVVRTWFTGTTQPEARHYSRMAKLLNKTPGELRRKR